MLGSKPKKSVVVLTASVALVVSSPVDAEIQCANEMLTVESESKSLGERVCRVAGAFLDRVNECGLQLLSPVQIVVTDVIDPDQPDCVARFRCEPGELLIVPPERLGEIGFMDAPFAAIPADALFDSMIAHELTHGLLYQLRPNTTRIRQEYLAHAFQISVLPEDVKADFLGSTEFEGPRSALINLPALRFFPAFFAAASWEYFEESGGYCAAVEALLGNETPF